MSKINYYNKTISGITDIEDLRIDVDDIYDTAHFDDANFITANSITGGTITSTGSLLAGDGSTGFPSITFSNNTSMGLYKAGVNLGFVNGGFILILMGTTGVRVFAQNGIPSQPSYCFQSNQDCGMFLDNTNNVNIVVDGGKELTCSNGFTDIAGKLEYGNRWSASMESTSAQSLTNAVAAKLTFNSEIFDTSDASNMVDLSTESITIRKAGYYLITLKYGFINNEPDGRRAVWVTINGTNQAQLEIPADTAGLSGTLSTVFSLSVSDLIEFAAFQTNAATGNVNIGATAGRDKVIASVIYLGDS